jgi:PLD-like domain
VIDLISSPFRPAFQQFVDSLESNCIICSPYITLGPTHRLIAAIRQKRLEQSLVLTVVTDLSVGTLLQGATDVTALQQMAESIRNTQIVYLPRVHAKVYVSGDSLAIVSSANLTDGGLTGNLEYGVALSEPSLVRRVRADVEDYARLGGQVTLPHLTKLRERIAELRAAVEAEQRSISSKLRSASRELERETEDDLLRVRIHDRSINAIFAETILYLLGRRSMTTVELHGQIREIHPDLCDDRFDRVIDGQHFGKLWKHQVRTAQQHLKGRYRIVYDAHTRLWTR